MCFVCSTGICLRKDWLCVKKHVWRQTAGMSPKWQWRWCTVSHLADHLPRLWAQKKKVWEHQYTKYVLLATIVMTFKQYILPGLCYLCSHHDTICTFVSPSATAAGLVSIHDISYINCPFGQNKFSMLVFSDSSLEVKGWQCQTRLKYEGYTLFFWGGGEIMGGGKERK